MLFEFPHEVEFTTAGQVSVADVAKSLLANEQILFELGPVLEALLPGLSVEKISVNFKHATTSSPLKEAMGAGIIVVYQKKLETEVPKMIEHLTGFHVHKEYDVIVSVIFIAVILYGLELSWKFLKRKSVKSEEKAAQQVISGNYNTVINIAADAANLPAGQIDEAIKGSFVKRGKNLAQSALKFIAPAKRERGATIKSGGAVIEAESVEAAPSDLQIEEGEINERSVPYQRQEVVIHATDLDSTKRGWAGHIPGVWEKRLRMILFPGISTPEIFAKTQITADIIVLQKQNDEGEFVPYLFHVVKVYDEAAT